MDGLASDSRGNRARRHTSSTRLRELSAALMALACVCPSTSRSQALNMSFKHLNKVQVGENDLKCHLKLKKERLHPNR